MITPVPYESLGRAERGRLSARHHFSFAEYRDPARMSFGELLAVNDDTIAPGGGFGTHGHADMEIITCVRQGAVTHADDQGNRGRTAAGDVQVMSAGSGVRHSEHNYEDIPARLYQIWIAPRETGVAPAWANAEFPRAPVTGALPLLVSGDGRAPLSVCQDAFIYGGRLAPETALRHPVAGQAYVLMSAGEAVLDGVRVTQGDAAAVTGVKSAEIAAGPAGAEILVIDVPACGARAEGRAFPSADSAAGHYGFFKLSGAPQKGEQQRRALVCAHPVRAPRRVVQNSARRFHGPARAVIQIP